MVESHHILVTTTIFPNSQEQSKGVYIFKIVEALSKLCSVRVIAPVPFCPPLVRSDRYVRYREVPHQERLGGVPIYHPRYLVIPRVARSFYGFFYFLGLLRTFLALRREFRPNVLLAFWAYPDGFGAMLLGKFLKIPLVIGCRGCDVNSVGDSFLRKKWTQLALKKSRKIFAVSQAMKQVLQALGVETDKIAVVPNGIDLRQFQPTEPEEARRRLKHVNFRFGERVVLYCGRLSHEKGILFLIRALQLVKERYRPIRLLIVGEGPLKAQVRSLCQELGLEENVTMLGELQHDAVTTVMSASDLLCAPSIREGWPNVVVEALSCGVPVVASKVGGVPEILNSPVYGRMVPPGDPRLLADTLWEALNVSWDRRLIQMTCRSRTWDIVASEMLVAMKNAGVLSNLKENCQIRSAQLEPSEMLKQ
jgi:glycosyltransferase involved in cell wall biosynthesis